MRKQITGLIVVGILAVVGAVSAEDVRTNPKVFRVGDSGTVVVIEGTWQLVTGSPSVEIPRVNSVRLECHRAAKRCTEHTARLIRPSDDTTGLIKQSSLFVMREEFRVVEWSRNVIYARAEPRAADVELRISLSDRTAERTSRETSARGAQGAKPAIVNAWKLE